MSEFNKLVLSIIGVCILTMAVLKIFDYDKRFWLLREAILIIMIFDLIVAGICKLVYLIML